MLGCDFKIFKTRMMEDKKKTTERFFKVLNELMATKLIDPYALKIYAVINSFTQNSPDKCFKGSNKYLSIVTGVNEKTVKKKVKLLLDRPWILTNDYQNELRRLQAIPVEMIEELQEEYKTTLEALEELTKNFEEGKAPLEVWLDKKREQESKEKKGSPKEGVDVPKDKNKRKDEDNGVPLDSDDIPEETPEIPHSDTSDKTSQETSGETVDETSSDTDNDQSEEKLDDVMGDLIEIDDDSSLNNTPPTKSNAEHIPTLDELEYADDASNEMKEFKRLVEEYGKSNPTEIIQGFYESTKKRIVMYDEGDLHNPTSFIIFGKTSKVTTQSKFDKNKFMVVNSDWTKEIISQYV